MCPRVPNAGTVLHRRCGQRSRRTVNGWRRAVPQGCARSTGVTTNWSTYERAAGPRSAPMPIPRGRSTRASSGVTECAGQTRNRNRSLRPSLRTGRKSSDSVFYYGRNLARSAGTQTRFTGRYFHPVSPTGSLPLLSVDGFHGAAASRSLRPPKAARCAQRDAAVRAVPLMPKRR